MLPRKNGEDFVLWIVAKSAPNGMWASHGKPKSRFYKILIDQPTYDPQGRMLADKKEKHANKECSGYENVKMNTNFMVKLENIELEVSIFQRIQW